VSAAAKFRATHLPAFYLQLYPALVAAARDHGYALAVHGSMVRDLDLIAVPWTAEASDALTLIKKLKEVTGTVTHGAAWDHLVPDCTPGEKPHGRVAYSLHLTDRGCEGPYFDVSVMPRVTPASVPISVISG